MMKTAIVFLALLLSALGAHAQNAMVVTNCGTLPVLYSAGATRNVTVDVNGQSCISGNISASTTVKATAAPPAYVEGTTNPISSDLSGNLRTLATLSFPTIGAAVPATGSYTAINVGGTLTGWTGAVTNTGTFATQSAITAAASSAADGWDVTQGAKADAACGTDNGTCSIASLLKRANQNLTTVNNSVGAAIPAGSAIIGKVGIDQTTPGTTNLVQASQDPCTYQSKTNAAFQTAVATASVVSGVAAKKVYVCSLSLISGSAAAVSLIEGSATCASPAAVIGSTTAANGLSLAANGGLTLGSGIGTVAATGTAANALCLLQSGTSSISGNLTYVQQ